MIMIIMFAYSISYLHCTELQRVLFQSMLYKIVAGNNDHWVSHTHTTHTHTHTHARTHAHRRYCIQFSNLVPYCPAVTPPPFATYFQEKEGGGGRNNEDLRFHLAVKPPPHPTNSRTLWCGRRRELLRLTCCDSTEGWKSCWPRTCCKTKHVVSQPDSAHRPRRQDDGLRKPSEISKKGQDQFTSYFLYA